MEFAMSKISGDHWLAGCGLSERRRHWGMIPPVWRSINGQNGKGEVTGAILPASDWGMYLSFNLTNLTWEISGNQAPTIERGSATSAKELFQKCIPLLEKMEDQWISQLSEQSLKGIKNAIANRS